MVSSLCWCRWMNIQSELAVSQTCATISDECLHILEWARSHRGELVSKTFERNSHTNDPESNRKKSIRNSSYLNQSTAVMYAEKVVCKLTFRGVCLAEIILCSPWPKRSRQALTMDSKLGNTRTKS